MVRQYRELGSGSGAPHCGVFGQFGAGRGERRGGVPDGGADAVDTIRGHGDVEQAEQSQHQPMAAIPEQNDEQRGEAAHGEQTEQHDHRAEHDQRYQALTLFGQLDAGELDAALQ